MEHDSTLGMTITSSGIEFKATGNAADGERRGIFLGKALMYDEIEHELFISGLLSPAIKDVFHRINRKHFADDAEKERTITDMLDLFYANKHMHDRLVEQDKKREAARDHGQTKEDTE